MLLRACALEWVCAERLESAGLLEVLGFSLLPCLACGYFCISDFLSELSPPSSNDRATFLHESLILSTLTICSLEPSSQIYLVIWYFPYLDSLSEFFPFPSQKTSRFEWWGILLIFNEIGANSFVTCFFLLVSFINIFQYH